MAVADAHLAADPLTPTFEWDAHPARQRPGAAIGAGIVIVALGAFTVFLLNLSGSSAMLVGLAICAAFFMSLSRFYLPSQYTLDDEGITIRTPLRTIRASWNGIRRFRTDRRGGFLGRRARPTWIDMHRGLHLQFGADREAAVERIQRHLDRDPASEMSS